MLSTWSEPTDPNSYLMEEFVVTKALEYVKKLNQEQDVKITMTHLVGYAAAWGLNRIRRDVGRLPYGFFKHDKKRGVTILVDVEGGADLVPVTIFQGEELGLIEFARICNERVKRAKAKKDENHNKSTASMNFVPAFLGGPIVHLLSYISINMGFDIPAAGLKHDQFGHLIVTNIGTLGLKSGLAPLCPPMRAMGLLCTGKIDKRAIVDQETDEITV